MSTGASEIGEVLLGRTRSRLLATILANPDTTFAVRQLSRKAATSPGTAQRDLRLLTNVGLVVRTSTDGEVRYRANATHPIFSDLQSLLAKTTGVFQVLRGALSPFAARLEFAFVYGSFARHEERPESDIDLFLCGEVAMDDALELLAPVTQNLNRPISPTIYAREELRVKLRAGNHFLTSLQSATLTFLVGNEDEFRAIR